MLWGVGAGGVVACGILVIFLISSAVSTWLQVLVYGNGKRNIRKVSCYFRRRPSGLRCWFISTVMPFLQALNASDNQWTPYAAMVQLELLEVFNGSMTDYAVRLLYRGKERRFPYCDSSPCSLAQFSKYIQEITPQDPATDCKVTNPKITSPQRPSPRGTKWT